MKNILSLKCITYFIIIFLKSKFCKTKYKQLKMCNFIPLIPSNFLNVIRLNKRKKSTSDLAGCFIPFYLLSLNKNNHNTEKVHSFAWITNKNTKILYTQWKGRCYDVKLNVTQSCMLLDFYVAMASNSA